MEHEALVWRFLHEPKETVILGGPKHRKCHERHEHACVNFV